MTQDDVIDDFEFVNKPDDRPLSLRPTKRKEPSKWRKRLLTVVALWLHGVILAGFLNFTGSVQIPGLDGLTKERLFPPRPETVAVPPPSQPNPVIPPNPARQDWAVNPQPYIPPKVAGTNFPTQQPKPRIAPPANDEAVEPAGPLAPEVLLESKGLVRRPDGFSLKSEEDVKSKLIDLRSQAERYNAASLRLTTISVAIAQIRELEQAVDNANAVIAELKFQMDQYPFSWRRSKRYHGNNNIDNDTWEGLNAQRDQLIRQKDTVMVPDLNARRREKPGQYLAEAENAFRTQREYALRALNDLREAVAVTIKGYEAAANDPEIGQAMEKLNEPKLAASSEFALAVKDLGKFEKWIGQKPTFAVPKPPPKKRAK